MSRFTTTERTYLLLGITLLTTNIVKPDQGHPNFQLKLARQVIFVYWEEKEGGGRGGNMLPEEKERGKGGGKS